jgi:putative ABC transport system substrate-binding protein
MRRRDFIVLFGAAAGWPQAARAQSKPVPVIGFLHSGSQQGAAKNVDALRQVLREAGYVEGQNVTIEYRWADNQYDRLPALAADLVARQVTVIMACGVTIGQVSAKKATSTIPIVFVSGGDPIGGGLVASLNPRSGNVTGATFFGSQLGPKRLELLLELVPEAKSVRLLSNPDNSDNIRTERTIVDAAARRLGLNYDVVNARSESDLDEVFATLVQERVGALVVSNDALFNNRTEQLVALAARYAIPTIYFLREFAVAGGLISYGASITNTYRQAGTYVGRILNGAKPAELPILQPTKFELVINMNTARTLGLVVPSTLLTLADEVIE